MRDSISNPYNMRGMIPIESDMFFGRDREMRLIEGMLSSDPPQCVSVVGERRIGKSSLAFRVFHKIKKFGNTLAIFLDCDGLSEECQTKDHFFKLLNKFFLEALAHKPEIVEFLGKSRNNLFDSYPSFKDFVERKCGKEIKLLIFLDEFEHLLKNNFADDTFFSNLRSMANSAENRLAFLTISKKSLEEFIHQSIQSSNFWNIFDTDTIGLLDHDGIERLRKYGFDKNDLSLTEEEIKRVHGYAGYFPFFNQMTCAFLWNLKVHQYKLEWEKLEVKLFPYFMKLWEDRTKEEQKILKTLPHKASKSNSILKNMHTRGLVKKENDNYTPFSDFFFRLIKKEFKIESTEDSFILR